MRPRDWMRLVVPGLCVGMLPACFNPALNTPKSPPFTGQYNPNYNRPQPPAYAMFSPMNYPRQINPWSQAQAPQSPPGGVPANQSFYVRSFVSGPVSPYGEIQYDPSYAYFRRATNPVSVTQATSPQESAEADSAGISIARDDKLLQIIGNDRPATDEASSNVGPFTLPEPSETEVNVPAQEPGSSSEEPAPPGKLPQALLDQSPIVDAVRLYLEKRPDEFREKLQSLQPAQREMLATLIPLTVRVGEGGLASTDPRDVAVVVDQLQNLLWALRPRAALVMDKFCFCQRIEKFGKFKPLKAKPSFQPGEMVEVYAEIRNVSSQPHRTEQGDFQTHLRSKLEIRNLEGRLLLAKPCDKPDETLTPQHDYFQHYRLVIPDVSPGSYVLSLEAEDVPTGRRVKQKLEFQVSERE